MELKEKVEVTEYLKDERTSDVGSNGAASERGGKRTRGMTGKEHQNDGDHAAACEETASEG